MFLLAGLGNPGSKYTGTRHNVGFMVLDYLAARHNLTFVDSKWQALQARTTLWQESVILFKPETFMNRSGTAVSSLVNYYKIKPGNVIIIHDDLDLELGRIRITSGGGDGGHKGIRSIINSLGTREFPRLKFGIGRPTAPIPPEKYVLSKFDATELELIKLQLPLVEEGLQLLVGEGVTAAMNAVNPKLRQAIKTDKNND
jgi:PTH1 family peptidyl-tRNA hydrolase